MKLFLLTNIWIICGSRSIIHFILCIIFFSLFVVAFVTQQVGSFSTGQWRDQILRWQSYAERKEFTAKQSSMETEGKEQICFFIGFWAGYLLWESDGVRAKEWLVKGYRNDSRVCAGITVYLVFSWMAWNLGQGSFHVWHIVDFWPMMSRVHWWVILVLHCLHCIDLEKVLAGLFHICGGSAVLYLKFVLFSHLPSVWGAHFHCLIVFSMLDILINSDPNRHLYSEKPKILLW